MTQTIEHPAVLSLHCADDRQIIAVLAHKILDSSSPDHLCRLRRCIVIKLLADCGESSSACVAESEIARLYGDLFTPEEIAESFEHVAALIQRLQFEHAK